MSLSNIQTQLPSKSNSLPINQIKSNFSRNSNKVRPIPITSPLQVHFSFSFCPQTSFRITTSFKTLMISLKIQLWTSLPENIRSTTIPRARRINQGSYLLSKSLFLGQDPLLNQKTLIWLLTTQILLLELSLQSERT